jgi:hypothetical protein
VSPVLDRYGGFVFYCRQYDLLYEPPHVHVGIGRQREGFDAKIWLDPVAEAHSGRLRAHDLQRAYKIVEERREYLLKEWQRYAERARRA